MGKKTWARKITSIKVKKYFPTANPNVRGCHSEIFAMLKGCVVAITTG